MDIPKRQSGLLRLLIVIFFLISGFTTLSCLSQSIQTINLEKIPQKKVRRYIETRKFDQMQDFSLIQASWTNSSDKSEYQFNEKVFYLNNQLPEVWDCYMSADPTKSWNGHFVKFGLMLSKCTNSAIYISNSTSTLIDTGQVYFLDLKLLKGLINVPLAFEITNIDPLKRIMEFSYIKGNKSAGKQTIQFFETGDGRMSIKHTSYFKSDSPLRDHLIYPHFHKKFIREFHRNMRALVNNN